MGYAHLDIIARLEVLAVKLLFVQQVVIVQSVRNHSTNFLALLVSSPPVRDQSLLSVLVFVMLATTVHQVRPANQKLFVL